MSNFNLESIYFSQNLYAFFMYIVFISPSIVSIGSKMCLAMNLQQSYFLVGNLADHQQITHSVE